MRLQDKPRRYVYCNGRRYRVNFEFRAVLCAVDVMRDKRLLANDRVDLALWFLVRGYVLPRNRAPLLEAIFSSLQRGKKDAKRVMDFAQDADLIMAGFRQAYGIDLSKTRLHWDTFCALLQSLPKDTRFSEVVALRVQPLPKPTKHNAEQRAALIRAKNAVALKNEDNENKYQAGLDALFNNLKSRG